MKQLITNPYNYSKYTLERDSHGRAIVSAKIMTNGRLKYKLRNGSIFFGNISLDNLNKAAKTANLKPVTIGHPPGLLKPSDVTKYQEGISASDFDVKEIDGKHWLVGSLILQSEKAIEAAESGGLGISAGYLRNIDMKNLDVQDDIEFHPDINHIAIACPDPRAKGASISLDEAEDDSARIYFFANQQKPKKKGIIMKDKFYAVKVGDFSMDEVSIEYDEEGKGVVDAIAKAQNREERFVKRISDMHESMDNKEKTHKEKNSELEGANKILLEQNEAMKNEMENMVSLDNIDERIEVLAEVHETAKINGVTGKFKTDLEGMKAIVDKISPEHSLDDAGVRGAYHVIRADPKDAKERRISKEALEKLDRKSMDDNKGYRSFGDLKIAKQSQKEA